MVSAKWVGKDEWLGELTRAHKKTGAIDGQWNFGAHGFLTLRERAALNHFCLQVFSSGDAKCTRKKCCAADRDRSGLVFRNEVL
jgi:hypothetical protein